MTHCTSKAVHVNNCHVGSIKYNDPDLHHGLLMHGGPVWLGWWRLACMHGNVVPVLQQFDVKQKKKKKRLTSCKARVVMQRWQWVSAGQTEVLAFIRGLGWHVALLSCNSSGWSRKKKKYSTGYVTGYVTRHVGASCICWRGGQFEDLDAAEVSGEKWALQH